MAEAESNEDAPGLDPSHLLMVVVGAHLRAEQGDRPLGYRLAARIEEWVREHGELLSVPIEPLVCSDIWYLNHASLQRRPTISIGGPGVNALSAYFQQRIDPSMVAEHKVIIQMDPEYVDLRACLWGLDHENTVAALGVFEEKYLDGYLRAVATQVVPEDG